MFKKFAKSICLMAALTSILAFPVNVSATAQGTDGTELEVVQAQQLEIQLGESWSGVEFELKTDAGMYPCTIPVGEDGILRFEVGGSERYILTCLNSQTEAPDPEETEETVPATEETVAVETTGATETAPTEQATESVTDAEDAEQAPVIYIIITAVGILLAIAAFAYLISSQKKNESGQTEEEDLF